MTKIKGVFPVLITPMTVEEEVDYEGLKKNIEHFISKGVAGLAVVGSTGEFVSLTTEERYKVVELAVEQVAGRIPVIAGTAAERTADAIAHTQHAEKVGADGALLINSYYAHPKENEIYAHFKAVAESVKFPIMIYNNPFVSGVDISAETMLQVAKDVDNITHVKESSGDIDKARDIAREGKDYIKVFCGSEDLALESKFIGATGWISVSANIVPEVTKELYEAYDNGDLDRAWELYDKLLPLCKFLEGSGKYVQIVKRAMELQGLAGGPSRKPRLGLSDDEEATLKELLERF